jgi:hypothetical protein
MLFLTFEYVVGMPVAYKIKIIRAIIPFVELNIFKDNFFDYLIGSFAPGWLTKHRSQVQI